MINIHNGSCKHNPQYCRSGIVRFCAYLFRRRNSLHSFSCQACGVNLQLPDTYTCAPVKVCYLLVSMLSTLLSVRSMNGGGVLSGLPPILVVIILYFGLYSLYRISSAAILAFCHWEPSTIDNNVEVQDKKLTKMNRQISSIVIAGINISIIYLLGYRLEFLILFCSIIIVVYKVIHKKWKTILIGLGGAIYSIISLTLLECCTGWLNMVNGITLLAVVIQLILL